jgi:nitrogen regulatory protein P-II 2
MREREQSFRAEAAMRPCARGLAGIAISNIKNGRAVAPESERRSAGKEARIMKFILAVIKPFKLDEVRSALDRLGVHGMTVSEANGFGRQKGHTEIYRGSEYNVAYMPKLRLEIAVSDHEVDPTIEAIRVSARTGQIGDGKIFVLPLERAIRVRTAETGDDAL